MFVEFRRGYARGSGGQRGRSISHARSRSQRGNPGYVGRRHARGGRRFGASTRNRVGARLSPEESALRLARSSGKPVPIPEMTTETGEFVALPNGDVRAVISAAPVRMRRDGDWVPIDATLARAADGSVAPLAHPNDLRLSGARPEGTHELAAVGLGGARVAMLWTGSLPEPVLDGPRATYVEALPGVDLMVEATRIGFSQSLVVKDRAAADRVSRVRLPLTGPGVAGHRQVAVGCVLMCWVPGFA